MQSLKNLPVISFLTFLLVLCSAVVYCQPDTLQFNGHLYTRLSSATLREFKSLNAETALSGEVNSKMKEANVNIRAVRHFKRNFKSVPEEIWSGSKNGYSVRFLIGNVLTTIRYTQSGRMIHVMKKYSESEMPKEVRRMIKPTYYDYSIVLVQELTEDLFAPPVYYVHLKDSNHYKIVRVRSDDIEEVHHMKLLK